MKDFILFLRNITLKSSVFIALFLLTSDFILAQIPPSASDVKRIRFMEILFSRFNMSTGNEKFILKNGRIHPADTVEGENTLENVSILRSLIANPSKAYISVNRERFIDEVIRENERLKLYSPDWYAKLLCKVHYHKTIDTLYMIMQPQINKGTIGKWRIRSVYADFLVRNFSKGKKELLPFTNHEINFIGLKKLFEDYSKDIRGYLHDNYKPNLLQHFISYVNRGAIEFEEVMNVQFHILQLNSWILVVDEVHQENNYLGWYITDIFHVKKISKNEYLRKKLYIYD